MRNRFTRNPRSKASGEVRSGGRVVGAETCFHWCDPETGERLEVHLGVSDNLRQRLAAAGFQPAAEPTEGLLAGGRESGRPGGDAGSAAPAA